MKHRLSIAAFTYLIISLFTPSMVAAELPSQNLAHDWGRIAEVDGKVSHTFAVSNPSDQTISITDAVASCGCTASSYSHEPIAPHAATKITVTFDPHDRPGAFRKSVYIYDTRGTELARLTVSGFVVERPKSIEELYPVELGSALRSVSDFEAFGLVDVGERTTKVIDIINTSSRPLSIKYITRQSSGHLFLAAPDQLPPSGKGTIEVSYFVSPSTPFFGSMQDVIEVRTELTDRNYLLVFNGISVEKNDPKTIKNVPKAVFNKNIVKFAPTFVGGAVQHDSLTLTNKGLSELKILAIESCNFTTSLRPNMRIAPGKSLTVDIFFDPSRGFESGYVTCRMRVVTSDPSSPVAEIRLTGRID